MVTLWLVDVGSATMMLLLLYVVNNHFVGSCYGFAGIEPKEKNVGAANPQTTIVT